MNDKLLTQMVEQYRAKHGKAPATIFLHPLALAALALKESVSPRWQGIPVKVTDKLAPTASTGRGLGVYIFDGVVRSFDL